MKVDKTFPKKKGDYIFDNQATPLNGRPYDHNSRHSLLGLAIFLVERYDLFVSVIQRIGRLTRQMPHKAAENRSAGLQKTPH
ncbi:hypothetical protein [Mesorhizobium silamurunense]|uniref:hypothetical protein n=1 Tax=Mesorhizobium silamurunense TaxID=499528 RepID=UPI0017842060|nr:hypothetical protein [Mesorhizobium silamurunense]